MSWSPGAKIVFTDEELVSLLMATHHVPEGRVGNWWTFFSMLAHPEQVRLNREAVQRLAPQSHPAMWIESSVGMYDGQ